MSNTHKIKTNPTWKVVPASAEHIPAIAAEMRAADRREVWASHRHTPTEALTNGLETAALAWTCFVDGKPALMWGVSRRGLISLTGIPWLLATPDIFKVRLDFLKLSRAYVDLMQEPFERLENYVHAENRLSMHWLRWCGFTVEEQKLQINDEDFYLFWRKTCVSRP